MQAFLDLVLSPSGITLILGVIGAILGAFSWMTSARKQYVAMAVKIAFNVVEDIVAIRKKQGTSDALDKVAEGLKAADAWMAANGWKQLSEAEKEVAKLGFQALNAESNVEKK